MFFFLGGSFGDNFDVPMKKTYLGYGGIRHEIEKMHWLVVLTILKNMSSSMGRMTSHT
jgi:hypothetical protein